MPKGSRRSRSGPPTSPEERLQQRLGNVEGTQPAWQQGLQAAEAPLRIVRGNLLTSFSGSALVLKGGGWTVARNGVGDATVTFTIPFSDTPTVTMTADRSAGGHNVLATTETGTVAPGSFRLRCVDVNAAFATIEAVVYFIAIGPA